MQNEPLVTHTTDATLSAVPSGQINPNWHEAIVAMHSEKAKSKCHSGQQKRGRKAARMPSSKHLEIVRATKTQTYAQIGSQYNISKQRVGYIVRRWKEYVPVRLLGAPRPVPKNDAGGLPRKKENRIHIVSFRLADADVQSLTRLAMDLFERSGAQMIPLLNGGASGMRSPARGSQAIRAGSRERFRRKRRAVQRQSDPVKANRGRRVSKTRRCSAS
jgi:hypothetical protein